MKNHYHSKGLTFLEVIVALGILGIIVGLAIPSFQDIVNRNRLKAVTETFYNDLKYAHSESIKRRSDIYVTFTAGTNWCYGIDDSAPCECATADSCQIDGIEKVMRGVGSSDSIAVSGFTTGGGGSYVQFEGIRGVANNSGAISISRSGISATVSSNRLGLISNCSNDIASYQSCS